MDLITFLSFSFSESALLGISYPIPRGQLEIMCLSINRIMGMQSVLLHDELVRRRIKKNPLSAASEHHCSISSISVYSCCREGHEISPSFLHASLKRFVYTYPRNVCDEEILFCLDIVNLAIVNLDIVNFTI